MKTILLIFLVLGAAVAEPSFSDKVRIFENSHDFDNELDTYENDYPNANYLIIMYAPWC